MGYCDWKFRILTRKNKIICSLNRFLLVGFLRLLIIVLTFARTFPGCILGSLHIFMKEYVVAELVKRKINEMQQEQILYDKCFSVESCGYNISIF